MGGPRPGLVIAALVVAVHLVAVPTAITTPAVEAAKAKGASKAIVACPKKVGPYRLDQVDVQPSVHQQVCRYDHPNPKKPGWANLTVRWWPDVEGERLGCVAREPALAELEGVTSRSWTLASPTASVRGSMSLSDDASVSVDAAAKQLRRLVAAAEPLGHACVPSVVPFAEPGPHCPLLVPHDLVRTDWYAGETPVVEVFGDGSDGRHGLRCLYKPAYESDGVAVSVQLRWKEGDPGRHYFCTPEVSERRGDRLMREGYHPVEIEMSVEFLDRWDGQALADTLVADASKRVQRCPDAPEGPAPYASAAIPTPVDSTAASTDPTDIEVAPTVTTIVLSGGPDEEVPAVGTAIEIPEEDQHQIVIGGPDGEVIREEFIGDQGEIAGYGPIARDADGNWSVAVEVETEPEPNADADADAGADAKPVPEAGTETEPEPNADVEPVPPPELIGMPPGIAEIVAGLPPAGAGAVRDVSDHLAVLGELLETEQSGQVTVPASDIGSLRELLPDLVQEVWLTDGSIVVATTKREIGSILVRPVIRSDGLISVTLSQYQIATYHPVVRALVAALNGYVAERGGRFTSVSVTPEGLVLTAERSTQE